MISKFRFTLPCFKRMYTLALGQDNQIKGTKNLACDVSSIKNLIADLSTWAIGAGPVYASLKVLSFDGYLIRYQSCRCPTSENSRTISETRSVE